MSILDDPIFWGPVVVLAMMKLGHMSNAEIFISEALATALILILDAPSGVFADLVGRKTSVVMGKIFFLISVILLAIMTSPIYGYLSNVFWAIGVSLRSGAESALIYDELKKRRAVSVYESIMKNVTSKWFFLASFATLASGYLAEIDLRIPLILSIPTVAISTILIFFFPKDDKVEVTHTFANYKTHTIEALRAVMNNPKLKKILLWIALFSAVGKIYFFHYNPYLDLVNVPYGHIGIIYFVLNLISYFSSKYAFDIKNRIGGLGLRYGFLFQSITILIQVVFVKSWCGYLFAGQGFLRGYISTVAGPAMNEEIESKIRATVLSFNSSAVSLMQTVSFLMFSLWNSNVILSLSILCVITLFLSWKAGKV